MKNRNTVLRTRPLTLALRAALATLAVASITPAAMADAALQQLIQPTNTIGVGGIWLQHSSDLFGQYNGLENSGPTLLGDISLRGGNGYGQQPGANTWFVQGNDLGTTSRSLSAGMADQGTWSLGLSWDQLRNYGGDSLDSNPGSILTPLVGAPGGNQFTAPSSFGYISTNDNGTQLITPGTAQAEFFHTDRLYVQRNTTKFAASHQLNKQWNVTFNWTNIRESGSILASAISDAMTGSPSTGATGYGDPAGQRLVGLPYPTQYKTNNFTLALNWQGDKGFFTGAYYGSMFHDDYSAVYFPNLYQCTGLPQVTTCANTGAALNSTYPTDLQELPPSNTDNELQLSGGYNINPKTQLVGGYTYGRNTQNMAYAYEPAQIVAYNAFNDPSTTTVPLGTLPVGSLDGLVVNQHANWQITNQTTQDLTLSAGMIYSKRDNRTPSNLYNFQAPDSGNVNDDEFSVYNVPMSNSHLQTKAAADWRFLPGQRLRLAVQNEKIERWCDSTPYMGMQVNIDKVTGATSAATGCAAVPESKENTAKLDYFLTPGGSLNFRAGVKWANRKSTVNAAYYNPITDAAAANGGGENDVAGWVAFFDASRRQVQGHFGVTWTGSSAFDVSLDGAFGNDQYPDSTLGVQNGHDATVDLQGDFHVSQNATATAYATWQMTNSSNLEQHVAHSAVSYNWVTGLKDQATTLGASFVQKGLMADKLSLAVNLAYSVDTNSAQSAVIANSGPGASTACASSATSASSCGSAPDIKTTTTRLNLNGDYKIDKHSSVDLGYIYQRQSVNDYLFAAYQMGNTPNNVLPWYLPGGGNPSYTQNAVYAEYYYKFQ